ncbi:MAG: ABC transporter ATP-binding protein [Bacteroidetes bacterium GWA2_31_9]|nr:MAG: ABC transporter ATP-binding protein [Bacteroidetes bacterium GWA2_31_9]
MDCGPTCLRMISKHYGKNYTLEYLREKCSITREGVSLLGISQGAEAVGFRTIGVKVSLEMLYEEKPFPFVAHWNQNHFIVVYDIKKKRSRNKSADGDDYEVFVSDPSHAQLKYNKNEFIEGWASTVTNGKNEGIALLLEPSPDFYKIEDEKVDKSGIWYLFSYLKPYKKFIVQLSLGLILGSLLQLIFPFLTQSIVDIGIQNQDINYVYLVVIAQLVLFFSRTMVDFIRSWILLHISSRINISLISDFLYKLMKLPISYFDTKLTGDIMQRIDDHSRIENFLTSSTLEILFSFFNIVIFGIVLAIYDINIFVLFIIGTLLYTLWVIVFLKKRREIDFKRFGKMSSNQSSIIQLITGMQEIKLSGCERQKRWEWEHIQTQLFKINVKSLSLNQYQQAGAVFLNETKNIFITFLAASAVINGEMTLGMMLSVQYIIGQLNSPVNQMINFIHSYQDAKLSLERLGEIHLKEDEDDIDKNAMNELPENKSLSIENISFTYDKSEKNYVIDNVNIKIPYNKVTAIVGTSGSGKTTLIKLLLGFYRPQIGKIKIGETDLYSIHSGFWRKRCGSVMQDGFIFSDTIANNIAPADDIPDKQKLVSAVTIANIKEFIETLPLRYNTKIGQDGHGLSVGQKQRLLIARAVYKNPDFFFLDEATNALDANNEKVIMDNLNKFFLGRTVVVVAHRLSTVKNADNIIVLDKGRIVEQGNHTELTAKRGAYYELVKNQLELGN